MLTSKVTVMDSLQYVNTYCIFRIPTLFVFLHFTPLTNPTLVEKSHIVKFPFSFGSKLLLRL